MSRHDLPGERPPDNDRPSDRYRCGRRCQADGWGVCPLGPSPQGRCGSADQPCRPALTFRAQRRRWALLGLLAGFTLLVVGNLWDRQTFYQPGQLSGAHAAVFAQAVDENRCVACHPNAAKQWTRWLNLPGFYHSRLEQTDSCVQCHHGLTPPSLARSPHNLPAERLAAIRAAWNGQPTADGPYDAALAVASRAIWDDRSHRANHSVSPEHQIQCAACHQEHGGVDADLTAVTNRQCQSCHSRTFDSFASGHPDWRQWPHDQTSAVIAFDHASHQHQHFTERFDCGVCHPGSGSDRGVDGQPLAGFTAGRRPLVGGGEPRRTVNYEAACAACHDQGLRQQAATGIDLIALPMLRPEPAERIAPWPDPQIGFFDGDVSPLARWLIANDPRIERALNQLPGNDSFTQIDPADRVQVVASAWVARALRQQLDRLATEGSGVADRKPQTGDPSTRAEPPAEAETETTAEGDAATAEAASSTSGEGNERSEQAMRKLLRQVPPQLIYDARTRWFSQPPQRQPHPQQPARQQPPAALAEEAAGGEAANDDRLTDNDLLADDLRSDDLLGDDLLGDDLLGDDLLGDDLLGDDLLVDDLLGNERDASVSLDPLATPAGAGLAGAGLAGAVPSEVASGEQRSAGGPVVELSSGLPSGLPSERFDAAAMLPDGGWYRDDLRMAIRYRGGGHADAVLQAVVELAGSLAIDDPVRHGLLRLPAVAACVQCHVAALDAGGARWRDDSALTIPAKRIKFSHQPHLTMPQLSDCTHCHQTTASSPAATASTTTAGNATAARSGTTVTSAAATSGFRGIGKSACVSCHTAAAAGDSCTQCHRYHRYP